MRMTISMVTIIRMRMGMITRTANHMTIHIIIHLPIIITTITTSHIRTATIIPRLLRGPRPLSRRSPACIK